MQRTRTSKRSTQRQQLIIALLTYPTVEKAAETIGMSRASAWRLRRTPEFQQELNQVKRDALAQSLARLQYGSATPLRPY